MSTTHHPLLVFKLWHHKAIQSGRLRHPYAACLSTVDCDGRPNARIIDLKDVTDHSFIFGTSLQSRKAREIAGNEAVSLTFWWDNIGCQVRACGSARELSPADSDQLFAGRSRHSKLATLVSRTGKAM